MKVTLILCDAADEVGGKLYVLGGGWSLLQTPDVPFNMALGVIISIPWDQANEQHQIEAKLMTEDGEPVELAGNKVGMAGNFETGRPPGIKRGTDLPATFALRFNNVTLRVGGYRWEVEIDGNQEATAPFRVVAP